MNPDPDGLVVLIVWVGTVDPAVDDPKYSSVHKISLSIFKKDQ